MKEEILQADISSDECYLASLDAARNEVSTDYLRRSIGYLASDLINTPIKLVSTGSIAGDFFLRLGAVSLSAAIAGERIDRRILTFTTQYIAGYVLGRSLTSYLAGELLVEALSPSVMENLLEDDDVIIWDINGDNVDTNTGVIAYISGRAYHNPYTHYTTTILGARCEERNGAVEKKLISMRYEVEQGQFNSAMEIQETFEKVLRPLR